MLCFLKDAEGRRSHRMMEIQCSCGTIFTAALHHINSGHTQSCGCLRVSVNRSKATKHGKYGTRTYHSWQVMRARCFNKKHDKYKYYGGRGITVCPQWGEFKNFLMDMGEAPSGTTIDRINNNLGYFKENCRWATWLEQSYNKRNTKYCTVHGETLTVHEWASRLNVRTGLIYLRLHRGWTHEAAVLTPIDTSGRRK